MSRPAMLWCKLYSRLLDDDDFRGMSLVQRGVYVGLLCHVSKQEPRGTFSTKNLRDLANVVADGDEAALVSTLEYLQHEWLNAEGDPHVVEDGNRLRFRTFEDLQRAPSEEPDAVKARQLSYKERNNGNKTGNKRNYNGHKRSLEGEVEGDKEGDREQKQMTQGVQGGESAAAAVQKTELEAVCGRLGITKSLDAEELVERSMASLPDTDHIARALACKGHYSEWEKKSEKQRANHYHNFCDRDLARLREDALKVASNGATPNGKPKLTPEQIAELEDPDHTGSRSTGFWPIPRGTKAPPSPVPEWGQALQRMIDRREVDRRDFEQILCRLVPRPREGDVLRLMIPRDNYTVTHLKETLNWPIRSALQDCAAELQPVYRVEGDTDDLILRSN